METSDSKDGFGHSGVKGRVSGVIDMLCKPTQYPLYLLFLIFLFYAVVDLVSTFVEFGKIDGWLMAQYHFVAGYLICAVYFKLVLPEYFNHKRRIRAVLYFLLLLFSLVVIKLLIHNFLSGRLPLSKGFLIDEFNRVFHFLILTSAVWAYYNNLELGKSKYEVEIKHEKLKVMHRSMQLSSHFVLNSLSVYMARIIKLSPDLATEFSNLISLLRYSFKEFGEPNFLNEEVKAVDKYLQIQSMRFPKLSLIAAIEVAPIAKMLPMPKLCLLTLVENVFFHGDYSDVDHPCIIKFLLAHEEPTMEWVFKVNIANSVQNRGIKLRSGFGASAVFRVLEHEFGDGFQYRVESDESNYSLQLTIHYGKTIQNRSD
ncbi:sensor histidine kinase YesM [Algoriphagus sp. 4150]|uniref:histidine kinase n=1 Tax=Algoriphagus sp. 4150 TaxID=2817756 RepID=UPI002864C3B9|nr:histidine kinase [Algoriphagus sp. 4150]MDR7130991.1 sensor histidine kinase YesM [Algoriphagus sp. 4150]